MATFREALQAADDALDRARDALDAAEVARNKVRSRYALAYAAAGEEILNQTDPEGN